MKTWRKPKTTEIAVGGHCQRRLGAGLGRRIAGTGTAATLAVAVPLREAPAGCRTEYENLHGHRLERVLSAVLGKKGLWKSGPGKSCHAVLPRPRFVRLTGRRRRRR